MAYLSIVNTFSDKILQTNYILEQSSTLRRSRRPLLHESYFT